LTKEDGKKDGRPVLGAKEDGRKDGRPVLGGIDGKRRRKAGFYFYFILKLLTHIN